MTNIQNNAQAAMNAQAQCNELARRAGSLIHLIETWQVRVIDNRSMEAGYRLALEELRLSDEFDALRQAILRRSGRKAS